LTGQMKLKKRSCPYGKYMGRKWGENNICFLFAFGVRSLHQFSTGGATHGWQSTVASCTEHERLAFELLELRAPQTTPEPPARSDAAGAERERQEQVALARWSIMNGSMAARIENFGEKEKGLASKVHSGNIYYVVMYGARRSPGAARANPKSQSQSS
jgi:hypothetical protein